MRQNMFIAYWFQSTDCDVINLFTPEYNRDMEGVIYTQLCSQSNAEILLTKEINCFKSRSRILHLYGEVTITGEGLQNLGLCLVFRPLSREGSL
jgi:hypothetical protein